MRPLPKVVALAGISALAIAWSAGRVGIAGAQEEPAVAKSARGGLLAKNTRNQFEVFFYPTGIRFFPLDSAGALSTPRSSRLPRHSTIPTRRSPGSRDRSTL